MAEALRLSMVLLTPVMPKISEQVRGLVGAEPFETLEGQLDWGTRLEGAVLGEKTILFPRPER